MNRAKHYLLYMLVGAVAHWVPDIMFHWLLPSIDIWITIRTLFIPIIVGIVWFFLARHPSHSRFPLGIPLFMLLGIWLVGPFAMTLAKISGGGEVVLTKDLMSSFLFWILIPILILTLSMMTKSSGGLTLSTLVLLAGASSSIVKHRSLKTRMPNGT